jgi:carbamoyltransferase
LPVNSRRPAFPNNPAAQLNLKVKFRESFRPFAPSVLAEEVDQWFEFAGESPYMLMVANVISGRQIPLTTDQKDSLGFDLSNVPRSTIPAVTHVDYSARIQTVHRETNPLFHRLISAFRELTGCPVLVNTSFNVRGEPIVCTPEDAFQTSAWYGDRPAAIGNSIVIRNEQDSSLIRDYRHRYELD